MSKNINQSIESGNVIRRFYSMFTIDDFDGNYNNACNLIEQKLQSLYNHESIDKLLIIQRLTIYANPDPNETYKDVYAKLKTKFETARDNLGYSPSIIQHK